MSETMAVGTIIAAICVIIRLLTLFARKLTYEVATALAALAAMAFIVNVPQRPYMLVPAAIATVGTLTNFARARLTCLESQLTRRIAGITIAVLAILVIMMLH